MVLFHKSSCANIQGKPLVGHNCLLDLLHMHTHFIGPLPEVRTT